MTTRRLVAALGLAVLAGALWWRKNPSACPYGQRFWVAAPHPLITRERLRETLSPSPGERVLEIGPGTGYYSLDLAGWLGDDGELELFDLPTWSRPVATPPRYPTRTTHSTRSC